MKLPLSARPAASRIGANFAIAWHSQAPWFARCRALALTLILAAGSAAPANGQRREEAPPARTAASDPVAAAIAEASERFAVPRDWIAAVMQAESGANANAVSVKGALGLMQVMPATWQQIRSRLQLGANAFDPRDNILAGTAYLKQMLDRYGASGFLAAYNAGPGRYDDHLATGKPLPDETQRYMARLAAVLHLKQPDNGETLVFDPRLVLFVGSSTGATSTARSSLSRQDYGTPAHQTFVLGPQSQGLFVGTPNTGASP